MGTDHHSKLSVLKAESATSPSSWDFPLFPYWIYTLQHMEIIQNVRCKSSCYKSKEKNLTVSQFFEKQMGKRPPWKQAPEGVGREHEPGAGHVSTLVWWGDLARENAVPSGWPFMLIWPSAHWCFHCLSHIASQRCFQQSSPSCQHVILKTMIREKSLEKVLSTPSIFPLSYIWATKHCPRKSQHVYGQV